jgi:wyosine [tRNA(Phe)-imidazoG37] synthetase (radical SAM superfamily)
VGRTTHLEIERRNFFPVDQILQDVENKISECKKAGRKIDYLTLVPDGEPTLDLNLGKLIEGLKNFEIPVAVISNSTLIDRQDVREELLQADWVSLKVDTVDEELWHKINRPYHRLSLPHILNGMLMFRKMYEGKLVTESMLISGLNDNQKNVHKLCDFLNELQPVKSYLSIPTRPPAEPGVTCPSPETLQEIIQICSSRISFMELLFDAEIGDFISTGNLVDDILSITSVHPLREEALRQMVIQAGQSWEVVENLLVLGEILSIFHRNERFFLRCHKKSLFS